MELCSEPHTARPCLRPEPGEQSGAGEGVLSISQPLRGLFFLGKACKVIVWRHAHTHIYTVTHIHMQTQTLKHTQMHSDTHTHSNTHTHTQMHSHTQTHIQTYTHSNTHTKHAHTHTHSGTEWKLN